jgi:hypothetical protein
MKRLTCLLAGFLPLAILPVDSLADEKPKLPADIVALMKAPDEVILYSLTPLQNKRKGLEAWGNKDRFHDDGVVGKVTLKDAKERELIVETILAAINPDPDGGALCFIPHHGVRFKKGDKTLDMSICFTCSWLYVYDGDQKKATVVIQDRYQFGRVFDVILTRHGVKLEE